MSWSAKTTTATIKNPKGKQFMGSNISGDFWKGRYDRLSASEKSFYDNSLPDMLSLVNISTVSGLSIGHILCRLREYGPDEYSSIQGKSFSLKSKYLEKFIGFKTRIRTLPSVDFSKKMMKKSLNNIPVLKRSQINSICPDLDTLRKQCEQPKFKLRFAALR